MPQELLWAHHGTWVCPADHASTLSLPPTQDGTPHLARFSVTFRRASCFLARFLAAASLAIFSPSRSLRPGSRIYKQRAGGGPALACYSARQSLTAGAPASPHGPPQRTAAPLPARKVTNQPAKSPTSLPELPTSQGPGNARLSSWFSENQHCQCVNEPLTIF